MFEEDRLILANVLSQIFLKSSGSLNLDAEFNYILRATTGLQKNAAPIKVIIHVHLYIHYLVCRECDFDARCAESQKIVKNLETFRFLQNIVF